MNVEGERNFYAALNLKPETADHMLPPPRVPVPQRWTVDVKTGRAGQGASRNLCGHGVCRLRLLVRSLPLHIANTRRSWAHPDSSAR